MSRLPAAGLLAVLAFLLSGRGAGGAPAPAADRLNVLFICIDDLRPQLGCYGLDYMHTPNLDRLAGEGRLFRRHYVQVPTCGASRYALWTGRYPEPSGPAAYANGAFALMRRKDAAAPESLAHLFRSNGYTTVSLGKVSHQPDGRLRKKEGRGAGEAPPEMPRSWDEVGGAPGKWGDAWSAFFGYADGSGRKRGKSPPTEGADVDDQGYPDGLIADAAIARLGKLKRAGKPFFFAVGFYKPHLPFNSPKKYWDLYDPSTLPLSPNPDAPAGVSRKYSLHGSGEMFGNYGGHPERGGVGKRISDGYARHLRHAYFAAVSYVDAQVGRVLKALEEQDLAESTLVVAWGDHGWHLGDQAIWGKHTTFERALRSTLIIRAPGMKRPGIATDAIIESVDLYPTIAGRCGITALPDSLSGRSIEPLLDDPKAPTDGEARGFWRSGGAFGHTLRTDRHRLVHWFSAKDPDKPLFTELYDHEADPNETRNVAAAQVEIAANLRARLMR